MQMNGSPFAPLDNGIIRIVTITLGALILVAQFTLKLSLPEAPMPGEVSKISPQAPRTDAPRGGKG